MPTTTKRKASKAGQLEATAYHEAGHAVASFKLGRGVASVTIVPDDGEGFLGCCLQTTFPAWLHPESDTSDRARNWLEREAIIRFAGGLAAAKCAGRRSVGTSKDDSDATDLVCYLCGSPRECEAYIAWLYERAVNVVNMPETWYAIEQLAAALLARRTLNGREAKQVFLDAEEGWLAQQ